LEREPFTIILSNTHHTSLLALHIEQLFFHSRHNFPDLATVKKVAAQAAVRALLPSIPLLSNKFRVRGDQNPKVFSIDVPNFRNSPMELEEKNK
jgi:hypothetical protein